MRAHESETVTPGAYLRRLEADEIKPRTIAVVHSRGRFRTAEIIKAGPAWVQLEYDPGTGNVSRPRRRREEVFTTCFADDLVVGIVRGARGARGGHYMEEVG